jgi:hypothetical protein
MGRQQDNRTADRIAMALEMIRRSDEHWHGLAAWLSRSGMDHDAELLGRLAARAARMERFRAEARVERPYRGARTGNLVTCCSSFPMLSMLCLTTIFSPSAR